MHTETDKTQDNILTTQLREMNHPISIKRDRVLVVASTYPIPRINGIPPFVRTLSEALAKTSDVRVITLARGVDERRLSWFDQGLRVEAVARKGGVPGSGLLSSFTRGQRFREMILVFRWLKLILVTVKKYQPTVCHVHWAFPAPVAVRAAKTLRIIPKNIGYFVTMHGADVLLLNSKIGWLIRWGLNGASGIAVVNKRDCELAAKRTNHAKVEVLPMPVEDVFFVPKSEFQEKNHNYTFVGRLVEKKGLRELLHAFEKAGDELKYGLNVIGDGPLRSFLPSEASRVIWLGPMNSQDLSDLLTQSVGLLAPFKELPNDKDGLPVIVLEAMAAGLPILATEIPGIVDLASKGLHYWKIEAQGSVESILETIRQFEEDRYLHPDKVMEAVDFNQQLAEEFTSERIADHYRHFLSGNPKIK